jgi:hypothetical protein
MMSDKLRTDAASVSREYIEREMDRYTQKFVLADHMRDLERAFDAGLAEIVRLKGEAESWEQVFDRACEHLADAKTEIVQMHLSPDERRAAGQLYCPLCYTFGNSHRKGCKYANDRMDNHIRRI